MATVQPASTPPSPEVVVDLSDHRPPEGLQTEIILAIRFDGIQHSVPPQELRQIPPPRYEQELRPVPRPPARKLKKPSIRLRRRESLQAGVQRLSLEHLDYAIGVLVGGDLAPDRAVHEARKAMRRVRGLLRLVRDELGPDVYRFENARLRDTGRLISDARTAAVALDTLATVEGRYAELLVTDAFAGVRGALEARWSGIIEHAIGDPEQRRQMVRVLRSARARFAALPLEGTLGKPSTKPSIRNSYRAIAPGLGRTYNRGRLRMADAYRSPSDERFHEWRKRVRYLRFQLETLTAIWPEAIKGIVSAVDDLGEILGEDHDLAELRKLVHDDHSLTSGKRERDFLTALLEQPRPDLQWQAWTKGLRVYAEPTDRFVERLGVYWEASRDQLGVGGPALVGRRLPGPA
jgi:CHAD domain-containing protein